MRCGSRYSAVYDVNGGVPHGSVLGLALFIIYSADLAGIVAAHGLLSHQYANESQLYGSWPYAEISKLSSDISRCIDGIRQLNVFQSTSTQRQQDRSCTVIMFDNCPNFRITCFQLPASQVLVILSSVILESSVIRPRRVFSCSTESDVPFRHPSPASPSPPVRIRRLFPGHRAIYSQRGCSSYVPTSRADRLRAGDHGVLYLTWSGAAPHLRHLVREAHLPGRCRLCSAPSHQLHNPYFGLSKVGTRPLFIDDSILWNYLRDVVQLSVSLSAFRQ